MRYKVLCTDGFGKAGLEELERSALIEVVFEKSLTHEELVAKIAPYDGLIVRSASEVSRDVIEAGANLKVVARAGVGTDNIDLDAATEKGIFVVNAPAGNTTSTAELTFAMILALSRHIPQAAHAMTEGRWEKKKFMGAELAGKILGVIGFGRIGREVARRARSFQMNVMAFDPYLNDAQFGTSGADPARLEDIYRNADYITVHTPLTDETRNLIAGRELSMMKRTAYIVNCARGGIVNEEDLAAALKNGTIAGAALDVFTEEPFKRPVFQNLENVILTPHLGASTREAQDAVAVEAALAVVGFFSEGMSLGAVNLDVAVRHAEGLKPRIELAEKLGRLVSQLSGGRINKLTILSSQASANVLALSAVKGALAACQGRQVTLVNAAAVAKDMGVAVAQETVEERQDFANAFGIAVEAQGGRQEVWGTILQDGTPQIVSLNSYRVEIIPRGQMLLIQNSDRPGVIGRISSVLGNAGVNIAEMQNVRNKRGADALTVIRVDDGVDGEVLAVIGKDEAVIKAWHVSL